MTEPPRQDRASEPDQLVQRASQGDVPAIDALLQRHLPGLRAYVRLQAGQLVRAKESCSDLVQSVCREILQGMQGFEYQGEAAFKQWLYTTALRKVIDKHRYWKQARRDGAREARLPDGGEGSQEGQVLDAYRGFYTPSHDAAVREELQRVEVTFDRLPEDYRQVITLSRIVGLPHKEIAAIMGRSEYATRHLLGRAMARMSSLLDQHGGGSGGSGRSA